MTATSYLVMEVLAARWRLGFSFWTFNRDVPGLKQALTRTARLGYCTEPRSDCNGNWQVGLLPAGIEAWELDKPMMPTPDMTDRKEASL